MMRRKMRITIGACVGVGLMAASVGTAQAQPRWGQGGWNQGRSWDRGGGWDRRHRRGDGFGVGDAIGVAALVGAVAIVASSLSKDKKARDARYAGRAPDETDAPPPIDGTDYGADVGHAPVQKRDDADFSDIAAAQGDDDAMTDACAMAARAEAERRDAGYAEVRRIDPPRSTGADSYNIDGELETRAGYRAAASTAQRFTCAMKGGRVAEVYFGRSVAAR